MTDYKKVILIPKSTIIEALQVIDKGAIQIALVIDENEKLLGTLTDGDIRRGLLNDLSLSDSIESIIFKNPTVCNIADTKEKILEIAVSKKIYQIPVVDNDGKLVGIEEVDELLRQKSKSNKVVLMVGGLGTRLRPLTDHTPKPMLKVGNKPILETIIQNFKKYGFTNIILCVSYKSEIIEEYFKDGSEFGVNIEYIHENKRMGTAGALSLIRDKLHESFFVMNGDLLTNINFDRMMEYHISNVSVATMGVREYDFQVPYGVVNVHDKDILSIEEKPLHKFFVSGGVYVLNEKVLDYIPDDEFYDMPTLFEKVIQEKLKSISFPIREYWLDIGRMEEYEKANNEYHEIF
ncbi:nucleotidyltransferase family protein [Sulfurimonas sp.]|jgi:dTDP-glucose pyrophosphorylase/predicted transcriptional regulator|uniref:nucleotidyltransferase family protein n=1 Tax=Sulfurimonas sp. TaxID=2022749 RepID=UPI0025E85848|nr:nucleotidyltransferase family protein [Sulfurimonas sp.]MBT5935161.1 CBS domain-containing protein [Sulfurimonas sp.]